MGEGEGPGLIRRSVMTVYLWKVEAAMEKPFPVEHHALKYGTSLERIVGLCRRVGTLY